MTSWAEYDRWNQALAEALFPEDQADLPAYIDVDDDVLSAAAASVGVEAAGALDSLVQAVRFSLGLNNGPALQEHMKRYLAWRRSFARASDDRRKGSATDLPAPPSIALLSVLVMAAQRMGKDTTMAAHAYYPRLNEVLGLGADDAHKLRNQFPKTEVLWRGVNEFLEAHDGRRGLPTAYALAFRYVGIPQSQALVRAADRDRLPEFFGQYGLAPGSEMVPADLERLLDGWITQAPSPVTANLQKLWKKGSARERVAGVVSVELSLWDGTFRNSADGATKSAGDLQLTASFRQGFGRRSVEFSFALRLPSPVDADEVEIVSAGGAPQLGVMSAAGGRLRPVPGSLLDAESLVGARIELREPTSGQAVSRQPKRVVPMRRDELLGALVEVDRVQLADDCVLLVKDDPALVAQVLDILQKYGHAGAVLRPGDAGEGSVLAGMPVGWVLIDDVQIYAIPQDVKRLDLHGLIPLSTAQLNFSGGLKLPGRLRKWSSLHPPEIRAVVAEAEKIRIELRDLGDDDRTVLETWVEAGSAMARPLVGLELEDGDYEVSLYVNGDSTPISQTTLRLRSADTPDAVSWETCTRLNYELGGSPLGALTAFEDLGDAGLIVDGLNTIGELERDWQVIPARIGIGWSSERSEVRVERSTVVLGTADPKSCVVTGAHKIQLPTFVGGKVTSSQIQGVCTQCGLRKVFPAKPKVKKNLIASQVALPELHLTALPSHADLSVDLDACLDALVHVGGGSIGALERVASQAQGGALFMDQFLRSLETHGHIDVRRDGRSLQPVEWEANPAYLAETNGNGFVLAGVWSPRARDLLRRHGSSRGLDLVEVAESDQLTSWFARDIDATALTEIVEEAGLAATVVENAAARMLSVLPPLSEVEEALPRMVIPNNTKATIFDVVGARWVSVPGVAVPGAYRVEQSFKTSNIWVDEEGAVERTARTASVQLVKHLAALHAKRPLVGYLDAHEMLLVPMGAELPGLYGRAAALCSGLPPVASTKTRSIAYRNVPRAFADQLNTLMGS